MNTNQRDDNLRALFQELRRRDAEAEPGFDRLLGGEVSSRGARLSGLVLWWRLALGAGCAVAVAAALTMGHVRRQQVPPDTAQWAMLSNWHASADSLLKLSATPWGDTMTTSTDAWIENSSVSESNSTNQKETL
jgi:hypothetical protein